MWREVMVCLYGIYPANSLGYVVFEVAIIAYISCCEEVEGSIANDKAR